MSLNPDRIQKSVRELRKLIKKAPKRPTPDEVHDLRTHTRRLEAAVEALGLDSKRNERRLLRDLARVRKRAGKVRDMDVLTGHTSSLHVDKDQDCLVQLLEYLGSARYQHAKKLSTVMYEDGPTLRRRLKRSSKHLEKVISNGNKSADGKNPSTQRAAADAAARALELVKDLENRPTLNKTNLHPYRLKVKQLHNILQMAENPGHHSFIDALTEVKDAIGEWHDWEELITTAADLLDHAHCKLLQELRAASARKYERALSLANKMRRDFLRPGRSGKYHPPRPILEATAAIAS